MKKIFIRIIRPIIIAIYAIIKACRRAKNRIAGFFSKKSNSTVHNPAGEPRYISTRNARQYRSKPAVKNHATSKVSTFSAKPVIVKTRFVPNKKTWWKNKRVIAGIASFVVIVTAVLAFALPGKDSQAQASNDGEYAALNRAAALEAQPEDTAVQSSESPAATESNMEALETEKENESALNTESNPAPTATPQLTPIPTTEPDEPELVPECHDARILDIQKRLMKLGYMGEDEPTDYYGWGTEYSLQLFQRKHGLQVDGLIGEETLSRLFADDAMPYTVKLGDTGTDVEGLQERLQDLNYLKAGSTGYFGTDTESAVKDFQERNGLSADGNVGEQTREVLYSDSAKEAKSSGGGGGSGGGGSGGGGGGGDGSGHFEPGDPDEASADALIEFALTQLGKKYVLGGKGPDVFDCSGFVYYCLNKVGYRIGYMTSYGWAHCNLPRVSKMRDMKRGDIICFNGHVGIYMGNGKMVDASSSNGKVVTRSHIFSSSYWTSNFICARRVF